MPPPAPATSSWRIGLLAAVLCGAAAFVAWRSGWLDRLLSAPQPPPAPTSSPEPQRSAPALLRTAPPPTEASGAVPTASATTAPAPTVTASAGAAPAAPPSPSVDPATLPPTKGLLVVTSAKPANVYVNGAYAGKANEPIETACGTKNVRLAAPTDPPPRAPPASDWLSAGQAVVIKCRASTTVEIKPSATPIGAPIVRPPPAGGGEPY